MQFTGRSTSQFASRFIAVLGLAFLAGANDARGQVTVTEIRVVDSKNRGVKSYIIERTRERKDLPVEETDHDGSFKKPVKCPEWHKLYAKPVAGPFSQSDYTTCTPKMLLRVSNVNEHPDRHVAVLVPYSEGTTSDIVGRLLSQELAQRWGQQVIIENRPGGNGSVGAAMAAESAPNGYTLLLGPSQLFTTFPSIYSNLRYDPTRDFAAVTMVATVPDLLVVTPSLPVGTIKELVTIAKAKPGQISFASNGRGTTSHLAGELFKDLSGARIVHVPYKGASPALADLVSGNVQMAFSSAPVVRERINSGHLKVLGVTGAKRSVLFPGVPTIAEGGVPGYEVSSWYGLFTPADTPSVVIRKINSDVTKVLETSEVQNRLLSLGAEPVGNSAEQFAAIVRSENAKWAKVVKASGARVD
jgi:tripartite-type tricarboxylate transporter receptor subunit TctC